MRILIISIFLISNSLANEVIDIKNLIINKDLKKYDELTFLDDKNKLLDIKEYKGNLILLNFWATWCAPCKEEMPSLDRLQANPIFKNLKVLPINVGRDNLEKSKKFYKKLKINNLDIYIDEGIELANKFLLRGLPTTVFINKEGKEFARVIGFIDFDNKKIIKWLQNYD